MIDWVSCKLPIGDAHPELVGSHHFIVDGWGNVEKGWGTHMPIEGSHESRIFVKGDGSTSVYVTGNFVKWWQGHNLWGTDDLHHLVAITAERVCGLLDLDVTPEVRSLWWGGYVPLTRVDCTVMLKLWSRPDVRAVLHAVERGARSRRSVAVSRGSTVYLGLGSRRWTLKLYSKGDELDSKSLKHQLPPAMMYREQLLDYADKALRCELQMRGLELETRGLALAGAWDVGTATEELKRRMEAMTMQESFELPSEVLAKLPARLVVVYDAWRSGRDLRSLYSRRTYFRIRRQLLDLAGVDISVPVPLDPPENVVSFHRVLEMEPMGVPEWAIDAGLYFQPPRPLKVQTLR